MINKRKIKDLELGFGDAEGYRQRQNKDFFNYIFIKNRYLNQLCEPCRYFLIGDKGTGKTAYATYLDINNGMGGNISRLKFVRETEYEKFIRLKQRNNLDLSDYKDVWIVILLLLFADMVNPNEIESNIWQKHLVIRAVRKAIDAFYDKAFAPEIAQAMRFVENSCKSAKLMSKMIDVEGGQNQGISIESSCFQTNLLYLQNKFVDALRQLKLRQNHLIFVDGIDIRPGDIPYPEYLKCVKGLANAIWQLNTDVFPSFRDSKGRFRVVMLARPDIFNSLNLQNAANKIYDNSVYLDWNTTFDEYRSSDLFAMCDKILSWQQPPELSRGGGAAWNSYFPWRTRASTHSGRTYGSFTSFLKMSYNRPRDIVSAIKFMRESAIKSGCGDLDHFPGELMQNMDFLNQYSEFLMAGIKDQLAFRYTDEEYKSFRNFFISLKGRASFEYRYFTDAFETYHHNLVAINAAIPDFLDSPERLLQFLYEMNIIAHKEKTDRGDFYRWCYRERTFANMSPRVEIGGDYHIHRGLRKALNVGNAQRLGN